MILNDDAIEQLAAAKEQKALEIRGQAVHPGAEPVEPGPAQQAGR